MAPSCIIAPPAAGAAESEQPARRLSATRHDSDNKLTRFMANLSDTNTNRKQILEDRPGKLESQHGLWTQSRSASYEDFEEIFGHENNCARS